MSRSYRTPAPAPTAPVGDIDHIPDFQLQTTWGNQAIHDALHPKPDTGLHLDMPTLTPPSLDVPTNTTPAPSVPDLTVHPPAGNDGGLNGPAFDKIPYGGKLRDGLNGWLKDPHSVDPGTNGSDLDEKCREGDLDACNQVNGVHMAKKGWKF